MCFFRAEIAAAIEANLTPWERPACVTDHPLVSNPMLEMTQQYLGAVGALRRRERTANAAAPPLVYTPLHGVGLPLLRRAFDTFALPTPLVVDAQVRRRRRAPPARASRFPPKPAPSFPQSPLRRAQASFLSTHTGSMALRGGKGNFSTSGPALKQFSLSFTARGWTGLDRRRRTRSSAR